jgi:hypothetical protein
LSTVLKLDPLIAQAPAKAIIYMSVAELEALINVNDQFEHTFRGDFESLFYSILLVNPYTVFDDWRKLKPSKLLDIKKKACCSSLGIV